MRHMPLGQFFPGQSVIHRIDARAKIISLFMLLVAIVATSTLGGYVFILCFTAAVVMLGELPLSAVLGSMRKLSAFFIIIFIMNAIFFDTAGSIWSWWIFHLSTGGVAQGANVVLRVALFIVLSNVLTCTTAPMDVTSALESLMSPLKLIRIPVEDVAMIISIAIQFIPTLMEETDTIVKAQIARGARFESKRLWEKAASLIPLVVPIFLSAFRRADELALAMEARGYRNARNRTNRKQVPLHGSDLTALLTSVVVCLVQVYLLG
ncbi:MAG: energy-coupling factor transporter transmembrane component T [Syntrophomonadaceae bacterium]|nr:energy-coupling factor transporter transmembrane component T [Syntrophomonadaceae bacterium]